MNPEQAAMQIQELIALWHFGAPVHRLRDLPKLDGLPPVPDNLAATITQHQPYRDKVIADAQIWCACPRPLGFGMEIRLMTPLVVKPFEYWAETVSPVEFELSWYDHMDAQYIDRNIGKNTWQHVALEDGKWRIIRLWDDTTRSQMRMLYTMLREHSAQR